MGNGWGLGLPHWRGMVECMFGVSPILQWQGKVEMGRLGQAVWPGSVTGVGGRAWVACQVSGGLSGGGGRFGGGGGGGEWGQGRGKGEVWEWGPVVGKVGKGVGVGARGSLGSSPKGEGVGVGWGCLGEGALE